jgi:hypothetical protein
VLGEPKLDSGCGDPKPELQLSSHTAKTLRESVQVDPGHTASREWRT